MTRAIDILTSRWCISFIGTALLAGLAWFFAPLLPGFEDWPPRVVLIVALLMVWGGGNALLDLRRLRRDAALAKGIAASSTEETEEAQALQTRLTTALDLLKRSLRSRGYLYEQPVVRDHRPARRRQDDGAAERRPALSAGRPDGTGRDRRHRRHAALRLVVHRGRRADRHSRPLHHAGLRMPRSIAPAGMRSSTC